MNPLSTMNKSEEIIATSFPELVSVKLYMESFPTLSNRAMMRVLLSLIADM